MQRVKTVSQSAIDVSAAITILMAVLSIITSELATKYGNHALAKVALCFASLFAIHIITVFIISVIHYKFYKGIRYGIRFLTIDTVLEQQLINAGIYDLSKAGYAILPKRKIILSDDLTEVNVKINSSLEYADRLSKLDISPGIGSYVQESAPALSTTKNEFIFSLFDINQLTQLRFNSYEEFKAAAEKVGDYKLMLDNRFTIPYQHILIVGHTGTGKTYAIINLLLQMVNKPTKVHLYVLDPKASSTYSFAKLIKADRSEYDFDKIVEALKEVDELLERRKKRSLDMLYEHGITADYRDMHLEPYYLIFDEFAAFKGALQTKPKAMRDEVDHYMQDIILLGRQLGFFMIIAMQKSDATTLPTALRDSMTTKIVLGNAEETTYVTAFGTGVTIPKHHYRIGEGVCTISGITDSPVLIRVPTLNFDLNEV